MEHSCCCAAKKNKLDCHKKAAIKDPVCGMDVDPAKTEHHFTFKSQEYHFCSEKCLVKFKESPERYAVSSHHLNPLPEGEKTKNTMEGVIYTCPMHPEVEQIGPGSCPKCGMALEPKGGAVDDDKTELIDMTKRFWICTVLSIPTLLLVMLDHLPGKPLEAFISSTNALWVEFALSTPVMLWGAIPFFKKAWAAVVNRHLNMFTLISIGTGVAYVYSVIGALFPDMFPPEMKMANGYPRGGPHRSDSFSSFLR